MSGTIEVRNFARGLDARRLPVAADADVLLVATDCHVTRGGEIEKRAAFVPTYTLPAGTVSLAATASSLHVFGAGADPGVPSGVAYQRLQNGADTLGRVVTWDLFQNKLYVAGLFSSGDVAHFYDGISVDRTGRTADTIVQKQSLGGGPGDSVEIFVSGISVTGGPVGWAGSNAATIAAMIAAINSTTSAPDYTADPLTSLSFFLRAAVPSSADNGKVVTFATTGSLEFGAVPLSHGLTPYESSTRYVRTIGAKMYTLSASSLQFSSVGNARDWDGESGGVGFGFVDTSQYSSGAEDLTAIVNYRNLAAVFAPRTIQLWSLSADPAASRFVRVLRNTGTTCPRSVTELGDADILYLDEDGVRSLRARDSSGAATSQSVGAGVDPLILAKLRSLTPAERDNVIGLIEPLDGRFWLIIKDTIFVLSFFPGEGIKAWTVYEPGFTIDDAVVFNRRVYLRSGDTIFVYGGLETGRVTDDTQAEAWLAYQHADTLGRKSWESLAVAIRGEWAVHMATSMRDTSAEQAVGVFARTTYSEETTALVGESTHISLRFRSQGDGEALIGRCTIGYGPARS